MSTDQAFIISHAALTGIIIPPVFILWILSHFQARRRKDPVRDGVAWMKLAYPFFFLSLVMTVAGDAMYSVILSDLTGDIDTLLQASNYLSLVSGFLEMLATTFTLVAFVELGMGYYALLKPANNNNNGGSVTGDPSKNGSVANPSVSEDGNRQPQRKMVRIATAVLGVVLFALAVALLGRAVSAYVTYYRDINSTSTGAETDNGSTDYTVVVDNYLTAIRVARQLGAAFDILIWVLSLPLIGFTGYLVHRAQGLPIKGGTVLLLVASIFWFVRFLWHLIYNALWLLPATSNGVPMWFNIADPLLNIWTFFVVLVLLYVLAARRMGGLWSTAQPWTHYGAPGAYAGQGANQAAPYPYGVYNPNNNNNPNYMPVPQAPVYQMPSHEQQQFRPQTFHEMPNAVAPVYPQELYAPQQQQQYQQYQGQPQQQQHYHVQQSPSPQTISQSQSPHGVQPTPTPPSGTSATPTSELKT